MPCIFGIILTINKNGRGVNYTNMTESNAQIIVILSP